MYRYWFENLKTNERFYIEEENPQMMKDRIRKAKYGNNIRYLGRTKVWG